MTLMVEKSIGTCTRDHHVTSMTCSNNGADIGKRLTLEAALLSVAIKASVSEQELLVEDMSLVISSFGVTPSIFVWAASTIGSWAAKCKDLKVLIWMFLK